MKLIMNKPLYMLDHFTEMVAEERLDERVPYGDWRAIKKFFTITNDQCITIIDKGAVFEMTQLQKSMLTAPPMAQKYTIPKDHPFGTYLELIFLGEETPWIETEYHWAIDYDVDTPIVECDIQGGETIAAYDTGWISTQAVNSSYGLDNVTTDGNCVVIDGDLVVKGKIINENKNREDKTMKFNFDFGSCEKDNVRMSPYGIAIKNTDNTWVSYDAKSGNIIDVDIFNFDGGKYLFKMPVAVKDVKAGDTIIHQRVPVYVASVDKGDITVIDPRAGDKKTILPTQSPFGFSFITKIVSLLDGAFGTAPSTDSPFGNMLPFFLMSNSEGDDIDPLMMAMLLGGNAAGGMQNPMMMALLCSGQSNMREVLPLMMLAGQLNPLPSGGAQ